MILQGTEKADVFLLSLRRKAAPDAPLRVKHTRPRSLRQRRELHDAMGRNCKLPCLVVEIEQRRGDGLVNGIQPSLRCHRFAPAVVLVGDALPARQSGGGDLIVEHDRRGRQIVEECLHPGVEERQPMLHSLMLAPRTDSLIKRIVRPCCAELNTIILAEPRYRGLIQNDLGHRCEIHRLQFGRRALGCRIEPPCTIQHVAEEIEPHRPACPRREYVDDATPNGEISRFGHGRDRREAHA